MSEVHVDAAEFEAYGFPAPEVMADSTETELRVWRVLEERGDVTIREAVDATGLSYQAVGRSLRLFEIVCPSVSKRPHLEDARITVFELEGSR